MRFGCFHRRVLAAALLLPGAVAAAQSRYARLGEFTPPVDVQITAADDWIPAERNLPLIESSWLRTGAGGRVEVELDEGSAWRLGPNSQGAIADYTRLSTGQRITLIAVDRGTAYFTGHAEGRDSLMLAVPGAQVTLSRAARVRIEVEESWSRISVLAGAVRFSSPAAEMDLHEGQSTRVEPSNAARFFLDRELVALDLDKWSEARDKTLAATTSAAHVIERAGLADLDAAGEWIQTDDLGAVWKPKVDQGWIPYRDGRWRWYDAIGYTWVGDEPWGWLPYHYGRWARRENIGWIWAPAKTPAFRPGEVYWIRGAKLAGWGPLAPGEEWNWTGPGSDTPQQFMNANTTFAEFRPEAMVIDPAGFTARPKEPLVAASFAMALPSRTLMPSRRDTARPLLTMVRPRVTPVLDGTTYGAAGAQAVQTVLLTPPARPPVVVITQPAPEPEPAEAVAVAVPVPVPVPVYAGPLVREAGSPHSAPAPPAKATAPAAAPNSPAKPPAKAHALPRRERKYRNTAEQEIATQAASEVNARRFNRAAHALQTWREKFPESEFEDMRLYYAVLAYDGLKQPAKALDAARPLVTGEVQPGFEDARELIMTCYLASVNVQRIERPTGAQFTVGALASRRLAELVPVWFTPENRPPATSAAEWTRARGELEAAAKSAAAFLEKKIAVRD